MKKNIGEKNTAKSVNFEVFEVPKVKKTNEYEDKLELLCGKYEDEKKILAK